MLSRRNSISVILTKVAAATGIPAADIKGTSRKQEVTFARHVVMALAFRSGHSNPDIAAAVNRSRYDIYFARKKVKETMRKAKKIKTILAQLEGRQNDA